MKEYELITLKYTGKACRLYFFYYVDIQDKNILARFIMLFCTLGYNSLGNPTGSMKFEGK